MYKIAGYFASLEVAGLLAFIVASRYQEGALSRFLPLLVALVAIGHVGYWKAKTISYKEIAFVSVAASVIFISVVQFLGFTVYPGLAKGIDFFSEGNAARTGLMLFVGTVGHFLLLTLARIVR